MLAWKLVSSVFVLATSPGKDRSEVMVKTIYIFLPNNNSVSHGVGGPEGVDSHLC